MSDDAISLIRWIGRMDTKGSDFSTTVCLVRAAEAGDRKSLDLLFERYLPYVRRIVALRMGQTLLGIQDMDDLVQEALMKAFRGFKRFREQSEGSFRNWLSRCVETSLVDAIRSQKAKKRAGCKVCSIHGVEPVGLASTVFAVGDPSPSKIIQGEELELRIEAALLQMKPHQREVIILRKFCEMSYTEVATSMGFGQEASARRACARAVQQLKELLGV
jgi:RNA polymerase sigma-70 factor (subfamily 1)